MNKLFVGLLVLLAGVAGGWYLWEGDKLGIKTVFPTPALKISVTPASTEGPVINISPQVGQPGQKGGVVLVAGVINYTESGFAPTTVTIKRGEAVRFVNQSSAGMWVASALHPTHQLLPGFDQLASVGKGGVYEYTFEKVGTWKYHNHVAPQDTGTVVVTE